MSLPPYLLKFHIRNSKHNFGLWLPLFLIWPIVLVCLLGVFLILLPFALLTIIFTWQLGWVYPVIMGFPAICRVLWNLRGMILDVDGKDGQIQLEFH